LWIVDDGLVQLADITSDGTTLHRHGPNGNQDKIARSA
jgi:hypothetical protein